MRASQQWRLSCSLRGGGGELVGRLSEQWIIENYREAASFTLDTSILLLPVHFLYIYKKSVTKQTFTHTLGTLAHGSYCPSLNSRKPNLYQIFKGSGTGTSPGSCYWQDRRTLQYASEKWLSLLGERNNHCALSPGGRCWVLHIRCLLCRWGPEAQTP